MDNALHVRIALPEGIDQSSLFGSNDCVLRALESKLGIQVSVRGDCVVASGSEQALHEASTVLSDMFKQAQHGEVISIESLDHCINILRGGDYAPSQIRDDVLLTYRGKAIRPKTSGQKAYVDAIRSHTITFGIGPAGTGKTYLAMAMAMAALKRKEVARIVLTRPVVEAGESLGYLPGTISEKVDPYVRPLYDALFDMVDAEKGNRLVEQGIIEIAPLAYMRGRTLNDSFVILDEAQNTTPEQMKMFLTRLGFGTKMVVTGDITQVDLPRGSSGLKLVRNILAEVPDLAFCDLSSKDVVRHSLVARIVAAYDEYQNISIEKSESKKASI